MFAEMDLETPHTGEDFARTGENIYQGPTLRCLSVCKREFTEAAKVVAIFISVRHRLGTAETFYRPKKPRLVTLAQGEQS
jgi:hypothetical protein